MKPLLDKIAVVGYDMTKFGDLYRLGIADVANMAITGALENAGIEREEIESLYIGNAGAGQFLGQEHLGSLIATESGLECPALRIEASGASGAVALRIAAHSILTGYMSKVALVGVEKMTSFSAMKDTQYALATSLDSIWETSMGATLPATFALMAKQHMAEYGTTPEQMAEVAVKNHEHARNNPRAQYRNNISQAHVLNSKMIANPIHLLDGCAASDGAAALILCDPEIAESYDSEPVYVRASKQGHDKIALHQRESLNWLKSTDVAAQGGYKQLGITAKDISVAEVHDVFTIAEIMGIEALGFVERGKGGKFTEDGKTRYDSDMPINTSGGLKARGHPIGASGVAQAIEIIEQFKGTASNRQVSDVEWGLSQSMGGAGGTSVVSFYSR